MIVELLETELDSHLDQSATAQWAIELLTSRRYKRYLRITKSNQVRIDRTAIRQAAKYDGKWVIETNDDTISPEDAARGYKGLLVIERCFRSMKRTQIRMTPMYHWLSRRIESHVKICVLALMIEGLAERACAKPWHQIRRSLDTLQVTKLFNLNQRVHLRNDLSADTRNTLKKRNIKPPKQLLYLENIPQK
jgi:transposase